MSYHILRTANGWITNNNGDFYVEDTRKSICKINNVKYSFY